MGRQRLCCIGRLIKAGLQVYTEMDSRRSLLVRCGRSQSDARGIDCYHDFNGWKENSGA